MHRHLIDEHEIELIKERGCCLGKYRVLVEATYYCFLEGVFDCNHQDRQYIKKLNSNMTVCKTNRQLSCEKCDSYKKLKG